MLANPHRRATMGRFPHPFTVQSPKPRLHALTPSERASQVFQNRLAPLGCKIEFGSKDEGGVFISLPQIHLSDFGPTLQEAILHFVESAQEVATMQRRGGERWSKDLEAQHRLLKKVLG